METNIENTNSETSNQVTTIRESISKQIKDLNSTVAEGVISSLVSVEIEKRKEMVRKAVIQYEELEKSLKKIKPDNISYNEKGEEITAGWTKVGLENFNKSKKELENLNKAIENAIVTANYEPLSKLVK